MPSIFDPVQMLDPLATQQRAPASPIQPLTQEEQQSLMATLGSGALSGLGYVGASLGKLGRPIRGALGMLAGKDVPASELLSWVPFSDAVGLTDPSREVRGSDLLGGNKDTSLFSPEGIGGLGIDIATDPLTYATFGVGALSKLGTAAKAAGVLPKNIAGAGGRLAGLAATSPEATALAANLTAKTGKAVTAAEVAGQRLGGHMGLRIPFTDIGTTFDLSGPLGAAGSLASYVPVPQAVKDAAGTVGRAWNAGFDRTMRGLMGAKEQELAPVFTRAEDLGREAGRLKTAEGARLYGAADMLADPQGLRHAIEGTGAASAGAQRATAHLSPEFDAALQRGKYLGDKTEELQGMGFLRRQVQQPELDVANTSFGARTGVGASHREDLLRPYTTEAINAMAADPVVGTAARTAPDTATAAQRLIAAHGVAPEQADAMAQFLHGLDPVRQKLGLFSKEAIHDAGSYLESKLARNNMLGELPNVLTREASGPSSGSMPIRELVNKLGLTDEANQRAIDALTQAGKLTGSPMQIADQFNNMHVPREVANALGAIINPAISTPSEFTKLVKNIIDLPANLFRGHVTQPFPAFHARNAATSLGWIQSILTGSPKAAAEGNHMMTDLLRKTPIEGIASWPMFKGQGLTDVQASEKVGNWLYSKGLTGFGHVADIPGASATPNLLENIPGMSPDRPVGLQAISQYAKSWFPTSLESANPLGMRGVGGRAEATFAPAKAGEGLASVIEQTGRGGGALALLKQGFDPDMAAAMTKAAHVDYQNLSSFEREVMRRLVPFYSWAKGNVPYQLKELMTNPGGAVGTAIRMSPDLQGKETPPDYLGTGSIINIGKGEDGKRGYLSSLGLPFEDVGNLVSSGRMIGQLNPLLKYAAEQATGRQLSTGRELGSLQPLGSTIGGMTPDWIENALANSPASRYISTVKNLLGGRSSIPASALNMTTGARLTDVDPVAAQRIAVRNAAEEMLRANPAARTYQNVSVPADRISQLSPAELQALRLLRTMQQQQRR